MACRPAIGIACPALGCNDRGQAWCETGIVAVEHHHGIERFEPGGFVRFRRDPRWAAVHKSGSSCPIDETTARQLIDQLTPKAEAGRRAP